MKIQKKVNVIINYQINKSFLNLIKIRNLTFFFFSKLTMMIADPPVSKLKM